jgi:HTH-type transcriptional regulator, sugar sensing transcriptional regulator
MRIEKALKEHGLKDTYIKVYIACLELGGGSVQPISLKAGISRSTCGVILERLRQKGLVSSHKKKTIRYYDVEDPKKVITQIKDRLKTFEEALPEFSAFYGSHKVLPTVRLYEGVEGMKTILAEILSDRKDMCTFTSVEDLFNLLGEDFKNYIKKRVALGIRNRVISPDSKDTRDQLRTGREELREVRIAPEGFKHATHMWVWGHKIAMFSLKNNLTALVIESEELAEGQRTIFEMAWQSLPVTPFI